MGQVGLEPTTALNTGFTVRGDTNYTVLTHMAESAELESDTISSTIRLAGGTRSYRVHSPYWLGRLDLNQRMTVSETAALPLGYAPI